MHIMESPNHTAWIMERGGLRRVHQIRDLSRVIWRRQRDDISQSQVDVAWGEWSSQTGPLSDLLGATGRYELCISRGDDRAWEGPITLTTFRRDQVTIEARDVLHYGARTIMRAGYDNSYPNIAYVTDRAYEILTAELARKEAITPAINVVPHIVNHHVVTDAQTSAKTLPFQSTVFEHIDKMAEDRGMDYTVVGRAIHLWDVHEMAMGQTQTVTERDFLGEMYVSIYGMETGTISATTDGQGNYGIVDLQGNTGISNVEPDAYYGEIERLDTVYDEQATTTPTTAELESQALRNLSGRTPTPRIIRVPDNSTLNMGGVLKITDLVPGVFVPMRVTLNLVPLSQMQKLNSVVVTEDENGETVQVTLYPAPGETV